MNSSLSPYWRIDQSSIPEEDQASILDGAIKAASLLDIHVPVRWDRSFPSSLQRTAITLDARFLEKHPSPLAGPYVDLLIGQALHQAAHFKWPSDPARASGWQQLTPAEKSTYLLFHHLWEDIFIHARLSDIAPAPALYNACGSLLSDEASLYAYLSERFSVKEASLLALLPSHISTYRQLQTPEERVNFTYDQFLQLQPFLSSLTYPLPLVSEPPFSPFQQNQFRGEQPDTSSSSPGGSAPGKKGKLHMASLQTPSSPSSIMPSSIRELTQQIAGMGLFEAKVSLKNARYNSYEHHRIQKEVATEASRLRSFFLHLDSMAYRWRRATPQGKVDRRRLALAATGKETIFKQKIITDETSLGLVLLMDVSASMRGYLQYVNRAAAIFTEALRPLLPKIWYEILTYTGDGYSTGADVQLTRLATPKKPLSLDDIWLEGGTPTAPAIAAAGILLKDSQKKKKIIIHFTDGRPKDDRQVTRALAFCRQKQIDVVTISVNDPQGHLYGPENSVVIKQISDLPEAATSVLVHLFY